MAKYRKAVLSIALMSVTFVLMVQNEYLCCLSSVLLSLLKLPHWSNGTTGIHMPIIYFGIPFLYSFKLVGTHVHKAFGLKKRWIFLIFVITVSSMTFLANQGIVIAKSHSEGLLAIDYVPSPNNLNYSYEDLKIETLNAQITLQNFSDQDLTFSMKLDSPFFRKTGFPPLEVRDPNGQLTQFKIEAGAHKTFNLDNNRMRFSGGRVLENGSFSGQSEEVILTSPTGQTVRLVWNGFWGSLE